MERDISEKSDLAIAAPSNPLYDEARASVGNIVAAHFDHGKQVMGSSGSGFFARTASETGLPTCEMVTDNHVVSINPSLQVTLEVELNDGSKHKATIVRQDPSHDLAFLKVEDIANPALSCKALTLSESDPSSTEDSLRVSRSHFDGPESYSGKLTSTVTRHDLDLPDLAGDDMSRKMLILNTYNTIGRQFSGSPYIDSKGQAVAIHEAGQGEHISVATPSHDIAVQLDILNKGN